jgi:hypothetical protein
VSAPSKVAGGHGVPTLNSSLSCALFDPPTAALTLHTPQPTTPLARRMHPDLLALFSSSSGQGELSLGLGPAQLFHVVYRSNLLRNACFLERANAAKDGQGGTQHIWVSGWVGGWKGGGQQVVSWGSGGGRRGRERRRSHVLQHPPLCACVLLLARHPHHQPARLVVPNQHLILPPPPLPPPPPAPPPPPPPRCSCHHAQQAHHPRTHNPKARQRTPARAPGTPGTARPSS